MRRVQAVRSHLCVARYDAGGEITGPPGEPERSGAALLGGLTAAQVQHYRQNGFVVLRRLYEPSEVDVLREEFNTLLDRAPGVRGSGMDARGDPIPSAHLPAAASFFKFTDPERGDDPRTFNSTERVFNRVDDALAFMPAIRRSYGSPRLLASAASLLGADFVPFGDSYVAKPPRDGAGFTFHQDTGSRTDFPYEWQAERGVNFGIYLHESTVENGCLHVIPGSHRTKKDMPALIAAAGGTGKLLPGCIPVPVTA
eukprot:COSAG05_NODE_2619_length_2831_cov_3.448023_1_plen_254_part_10